jgi:hypothetical protein
MVTFDLAQVSDPTERLILEQAPLFAKLLRESADQAPDGAVLACAEKVALHQGREFVRKALSITLQGQAAVVEKRGPARVPSFAGTPANDAAAA